MEFEDFGSRLLDRRVRYCQFRIQQAISLIDDEIERLSQRLKIYNSQIFEYREKYQDIDNQIRSAEISQDGFFRMRMADLKASISRLRVQQCQQIQEIKQNYALEIESLQQKFESILRKYNQRNNDFSTNDYAIFNENYINQEKKIQKEIDMYKEKIKMYRESIQNQENEFRESSTHLSETEATYEEIYSPVLSELMNTIEERSKERYQSLIDSKKKLNECVEQIEAMDRQHKLKISDLTSQINSIDNIYEKQLSQLSEKQEIQINSLKNHLLEAEKREKSLSKAANKIEIANQKQIKNTQIELQTIENLKFKNISKTLNDNSDLDNNSQESNYFITLKKLKSDIKRFKKKLHLLEEELREKRQENQMLKREIGAVKHEIRFAGRMVGSVYPYSAKKNKL